MPNEQSTKEWLIKSYHDLDGAKILFEADHYTDTIGYILQQSIEKMLKFLLAYENQKIHKTHNLIELFEYVSEKLELNEDNIKLLTIATTYNAKVRYPAPHKKMLPKEVQKILKFAKELFDIICEKLDINQNELKWKTKW